MAEDSFIFPQQKANDYESYEEKKNQDEDPTSKITSASYQQQQRSPFLQDIGQGKFYNSPRRTSLGGGRSNFQFHQIPTQIGRRGSRNLRGQSQENPSSNNFLQRFRSQTNISSEFESPSKKGDISGSRPPPSPSCHSTKSSTSFGFYSHQSSGNFVQSGGHNQRNPSTSSSASSTSRLPKPKKWFSFTNLLNRQNISSLLNIPKSRLSVSSTFNSVFVGPASPSEESDSGGNVFFGGLSNFNPISPTGGSNQHQVIFRQKSGSGRGGGQQNMKNYSSGGATNTSESSCNSERSSGAGYYTGQSSSASARSSTTGAAVGPQFSGAVVGGSCSFVGGGSRLSCGEFFTGTPNSPIFSTGEREPSEFDYFNGKDAHYSASSGFSRNGTETHSRDFCHFNKALGRSLPTLLESMESGIASQVSSEGFPYPCSVDSVVELLYQEFAILTGAKSIDDHYILTFPDRGNFHLLGDEDYRRLMIYLTAIPPMHDAESGFVIIVDRRNDKWNSVKTTLVRISNYFPGLIHRVFVLRPVGIFQKALSEISSKLFRTENLRFRLNVCNNISDLSAYIDSSQLTVDLGGSLCYQKVKWVSQRVEVEAFHTALQNLSRDLKSFTETFHDLEYPNDVTSTEILISEKHSEFQRLRSDLTQAIDHGEHLLFRIKDMVGNTPEPGNNSNGLVGNGRKKGTENNAKPNSISVQLINVISVERYIIQIEETTRLFEEFWIKEKMSLEQCLQLRRFEHDFREMQATFDAGMKKLEELGDVGECLTATDVLIAETLAFEISSAEDLSHAQELERIGREIVECNQSAVDSVEPKCLELSRMTSQFQIVLQDKILKQKEWREIQAVIEKANQLCNEGMDLVSCQLSSELHTASAAEDCTDGGNNSCGSALIARIDDFLERIRKMSEELNLFKSGNVSPTHSQSKPLVKQVLKRVEDVETMCVKRRALIAQQMTKSATKSRRSSGSSFASTPSTSSQHSYTSELKPAKSTSQLDCNLDDYSSPTSLRSGSSTLSLDGTGINNGQKFNNKIDEDSELKRIKRGHVLNELLQTERSYVEEIGEVLSEYRDQINNPEVRSLLPQQLQPIITPTKLKRLSPNVAVLFCNLDEIFAFHSKLFLPDMSNCVQSIELVGLCFIQRHADFLSIYSQYCQLLPASESLRKEIGENHPWFVSCRNRLGHKLPLGAYLLKPVQRITKYHLLLKDLVKCSEGCEGYGELVEALECMLVVLRCVNDGMHQLGISGYPGKLIEEGYLLLQSSFLLWTDNKKDRLRLKGHQRHLFLYQRSILICKKVPKSSLYEFRTKLSLSEVGLTEALKGSGASKKFEIWVNGRQKVFLLQAENVDTKEMWVREIKKLLLEQLESIRASKSQTIAACGVGASSLSSAVLNSKLQPLAAARRQKMMSKGVTMNGWRSSNIGHRALRQVSSWDNPEIRSRSKTRNTECEIDEEMWSSEVSNSDDDDNSTATPPSRPLSIGEEPTSINVYGIGENVENGAKYVALAEYGAMGPAEVSLKEGDVVSLVKVGCGGWWFVRIVSNGQMTMEGWAPSAYLEKIGNVQQQQQQQQFPVIPSNNPTNVLGMSSKSNQLGKKNLDQYFSQETGNGSSGSSSKSNKLSQSNEDILSALR